MYLFYKKSYNNELLINILTYVCAASRIDKVKKNIENYHNSVNKYFNELQLGDIQLTFIKQQSQRNRTASRMAEILLMEKPSRSWWYDYCGRD